MISALSKHEQQCTAQWAPVDSLMEDEHGSRRSDIFCRGAVNICYHFTLATLLSTHLTYQLFTDFYSSSYHHLNITIWDHYIS